MTTSNRRIISVAIVAVCRLALAGARCIARGQFRDKVGSDLRAALQFLGFHRSDVVKDFCADCRSGGCARVVYLKVSDSAVSVEGLSLQWP